MIKNNSKVYFNGSKWTSKIHNDVCVVLGKENNKSCLVRFCDEFKYEAVIQMSNLKNGGFRNPYRKSVYGVGYMGVGVYAKATHPKYYMKWAGIIRRCHSQESFEKHKTYIGCTIDRSWYNFQEFSKWLDRNRFDGSQQIDKDLLEEGNKLYSPNSCCLLPQRLNAQLTSLSKKGCYWNPINKNWRVEIKTYEGKRVGLGSFKHKEDALKVYTKRKYTELLKVVDEWSGKIEYSLLEKLKERIELFGKIYE